LSPFERLICYCNQKIKRVDLGSEFDELIAIKVGRVTIVGIYRAFKCFAGETENSNFDRLLNSLSKLNFKEQIEIIGDFNINLNNQTSKFNAELRDWVQEHGLQIVDAGISRSRWVGETLQESTIDFALTNIEHVKIKKQFCDMSDHFVLFLEGRSYGPKIKVKTYREFVDWKFDQDRARDYLIGELQSKPIMSSRTSVYNLDYWIRACLIRTMVKFVRSRKITVRCPNEIVSPKIVKIKNWRNSLRKKWLKEKSAQNYVNMVRACRILRREVRSQRKILLISRTKKGPKEFWAEVNKLRGKHTDQIDTMVIESEEVTDKQKIADSFINFFTSKVNGLIGDYKPQRDESLMGEMDCISFTREELSKAFDRLSGKKSSGMDNISGFFIKIFKDILLDPILLLFNKIMTDGNFPETWKIARIIPVHKKGRVDRIENYRPVSNLLSIAKLYELCVLQRLEALDQDIILGHCQHGFRKRHSTTTALTEIVDTLCEERDKKNVVSIYSADLTAAFDLLRKEKLVEIMREKKIPVYLIKTINSYLSGRFGYVQINESRSYVEEIKVGCVQGSILGPYLFNIYTSNLQKIVEPCSLIVYADDSYVIASAKNEEIVKNLLEITIKNHFEYLEDLGMVCNMAKTEMITMGVENLAIRIKDVTITSGNQMKILGVLLDKKMSWEPHVQRMISKCRSYLFPLRYIRRNLSCADTIRVLKAQLISVMTYACPVWSVSLNFSQRARIRSIFYQAIRTVIRDFNFRLNRRLLLTKSGVESIDDIFFKRTSTFIFNIYSFLEPTNLTGKIFSRGYYNERQPGKMSFFDLSSSRLGKKSLLNCLNNFTQGWHFDWVNLSVPEFKKLLFLQFMNEI